MRKSPIPLLVAFAACMLVAASPDATSKYLVLQGNDAFHQGRFNDALELYKQAETRITDPGLTAYNKAVALYRTGRFPEAELHFRRCLEGAKGERLVHGLYGLGNALVKQAGDADVDVLEAAVDCYRLCRRQEGIDKSMSAKVIHNLELARLLLVKARKHAKDNPKQNSNDSNDKTQKNGRTGNGNQKSPDNGSGKPDHKPSNPNDLKDGKKKSGNAKTTSMPIPGKGKIETLPDEGELVPLEVADARRLLQRAIRRIRQDRQSDLKSQAGNSTGVRDW